MLMDDHTIVPSRRFQRNVTRHHIGKHPFRIALTGIPEATSSADLDQKTVAFRQCHMTGCFARRQFLHRAVFAHDAETIRQSVFAAVQTPGRADGSLHGRLNAARREQAHFLRDAQPAAKLARSAGILP
jgi:hypothetical protein